MNPRERQALERIVAYCDKAAAARKSHFPTRDRFDADVFYGDGVALYIQQIGECVNDLSDEFLTAHPDVPWHEMRGMRNMIAHAYEGVDRDIVWEVLTQDLPVLRQQCEAILEA